MARFRNITLDAQGTSCTIIDQTRLPESLVYKTLTTPKEFYDAIATLALRGAPCLGHAGACAMACFAQQASIKGATLEEARAQLCQDADYLQSSRPTAVNLAWALNRTRALCAQPFENTQQLAHALQQHATDLLQRDKDIYHKMAQFGLEVLPPNASVLTHCNAGPLACGGVGSALGPALLGAQRGTPIKMYVDETRPLLQGARLTSFELQQAGVDTTLICDNMAATVMSRGEIDAVMVGADRIAANGDTANKIGTLGVAILAKHFNIPFYVLAPTSTIDPLSQTGADIPIEERDSDEIRTMWYQHPMAPEGIRCFNPSFDVTPANLITGIITEVSIARPPFDTTLKEILEQVSITQDARTHDVQS